ncbi:MAG: sigma-54 interaction domain-containing protein [Terriglobales bacterium]
MATLITAHTPFKLPPEAVIFGRSEIMRLVRHKIEKLAGSNVPVLIQGESGTGKEIIAKLIHCFSPWETGPFVKVNCPAIPATLLESELFGYERGAFTGAYGTKPGRVELAHRGTLFLDEIAELDPALQAKLLQLLQDGQFCRIGAQEDKRVEVRMICATNRELHDEIEAGNFRQDLFYRINVLNVQLPPLRQRREDIPDLVNYFRDTYNEKYNCQAQAVSPQVMEKLQHYEWPGNIRELENVIKRYVILGSEEMIPGELLRSEARQYTPEIPAGGSISLKKVTREAVRELERVVILRSLKANNWNRRRVARALDISYRALLYKIRDAGLSSNRSGGRIATEQCPPQQSKSDSQAA